jgi:hypothetical protein
MEVARQATVTRGRKGRMDETCVQTEIIIRPTAGGTVALSRLVTWAKGIVQVEGAMVQQRCRSRLQTAWRAALSPPGKSLSFSKADHMKLSTHIPHVVDRIGCMWERRATHGGRRTMQAAESNVNERLDHLGMVAGVCKDIGLARW